MEQSLDQQTSPSQEADLLKQEVFLKNIDEDTSSTQKLDILTEEVRAEEDKTPTIEEVNINKPNSFLDNIRHIFHRPDNAKKSSKTNGLIQGSPRMERKQTVIESNPALLKMRSHSFDCNSDTIKHQGDQGIGAFSESSEDLSDFENKFEKVENPREQYLLLIVHGIGTKDEYQKINISEFQKSLTKVSNLYFKNTNYEYVIRMVDWKSLLNNEQTKQKVNNVTVREGAESYREIFNETVVDILFYLSKQYRYQILQRVVDEAKKYYSELLQDGKNERFKGKVSIVAHSLGTVITYDLLARQWPINSLKPRRTMHIFDKMDDDSTSTTLDSTPAGEESKIDEKAEQNALEDQLLQIGFPIDHFFLLGSPLGLFVSIYNEENFVRQKLPTTNGFYNIFHPSDLIAYRVEPLFQQSDNSTMEKEILPPAKLPYYKNNGYRTYNSIGNFFKKNPNNIIHSCFQQIHEIKEQFKIQESQLLISQSNAGYGTNNDPDYEDNESFDNPEYSRFDFVLQEKGIETIIKPVGLLKSHIKYFISKDCAYFILKKLHRQPVPYYL